MNIKCLIFSTLILEFHSLSAQLINPPSHLDSFFIETPAANQYYFNYKVNKKQTLYHIARSFHIELDSLLTLNQEVQGTGLPENYLLKIPLHNLQILTDESKIQDSCVGIYYKIKTGESLYQLSKRKFEINLQKLMVLNKLKDSKLKDGTILLLGYYPITKTYQLAPILENKTIRTEEVIEEIETDNWTRSTRGVAICEYDQLGSGRLFALHNTAIMDSQIEIVNPVLNRKVYAKVIGRIPPIYEHDVQVIVSPEAARLLGAVDKRFFVSLRYR